MTTFFPAFGESRVENVVNFLVNANPLTFSFRTLAIIFPELVAPLGAVNDVVLTSVQPPDNLFEPGRLVRRPLTVGDRVSSPNRAVAGGNLFGGYILAFVPQTEGAIVVWDGGFLTYDPLTDLQPQSLASLV